MTDVTTHYCSVIDALTAHVALLDGDGCIVAVNDAWRQFADANGSSLPAYGIGSNYLGLLRRLAGAPRGDRLDAEAIAAGIEGVLDGSSRKFQLEYPCHAPTEERWYLLTVTPFPPDGRIRAVVAHENITTQKQAEIQARRDGARLADTFSSMVEAIGLAVEKRDPYTAGHQRQVATLAVEIGRVLHLAEDRLFGLHLGASIHDIGKISVPAEILSHPGKLSAPEHAIIRCHPAVGEEILRGIDFPWPIADMVWQHHERLDGSGYPRGLCGNAICLEARIIAVADVFDAIVSHRPYRPGRNLADALAELQQGRGQIYDPDVVDAGLSFFAKVGGDWHRTHFNLPGDFQHLV